MGGIRRALQGLVGVTVVLTAGCFSPSKEAEARLASLHAEAQSMDAGLDSVEERLLGNQAMLQQWQEMSRRHKQVSQLHCAQADNHLVAMADHMDKQVAKLRKGRRSKVAAVNRKLTGKGGPVIQRN